MRSAVRGTVAALPMTESPPLKGTPGFWHFTLLTLAVLLGIDRFGRPWSFRQLFPPLEADPAYSTLAELVWWCACCVLFFWWVPAYWMRRRGEDWRPAVGSWPEGRHLLLYLAFYLTVLPLILFYFRDDRFVATYPFYRFGCEFPVLFVLWELSYGLMFFSLEFFFRGFLIRQLCPRWGWGALWFSAIPYCLIHYYKPLPEMMGALPAGLALGYASWRTGSIWGGLAVHLGVAYTMDGLQLLYKLGVLS